MGVEISGFLRHLELREIYLVILNIQNCHFDHFSYSELWIFDIFKCEIAQKKSKFKAYKMIKMAGFDLLTSAKIDFT